MTREESAKWTFLKHEECPKCGSKDGLAVYAEGHRYCYSHGCGYYSKTEDGSDDVNDAVERKTVSKKSTKTLPVEYANITARHITEETCRHLGYGIVDYKGQKVQAANYYDSTGTLVAQKIRLPSKEFFVLGDLQQAGMYGQHRFRNGGRMLVITEGEIDALSVSQVLGNTWPVVSVSRGAKGARSELARHLEWLERFDRVVLLFDMDEPGRDAAQECAELLSPGKACIGVLPHKDANEMLQQGKAQDLVSSVWNAKPYRPDGIVNGSELWDLVSTHQGFDTTPYPWDCLNRRIKGARKGEIILVTAGTGIGKSSFVAELAYGWLSNTMERIGYIALEESVRETAFRFLSLEANERLMLKDEPCDPAKLKAAFTKTLGTGRIWFYDHFGSLEQENLLSKIRYMVKSLGIRIVILDHVSIVVSGVNHDGDGGERKAIDVLLTRLASMVKELDCTFVVISHLKKIDGKSHEEGGQVSLNDLRGSATLKSIPMDIIALERDQQDPRQKSFTHIRVLKSRSTGYTGTGGWLQWHDDTGRMIEVEDPTTGVAAFKNEGEY
jgi:twinkle protein